MDREQHRRRRLPSHGTLVAYVALFLALCGSGYAATKIGGAVKVTCTATRNHKRVSCAVVGTPARGPRGFQGPTGPQGPQGPAGAKGGMGPTTFTSEPAFIVDPHNNPNFLTAIAAVTPNTYFEGQYSVAEDSNAVNDARNDVYMPLESPSQIGGSATHLASVQFCINISGQTNTSYTGKSVVSVDKATVYEVNEPKPAGGAGSGTSGGPPAYSTPVPVLQQTYTGQSQINDCLTASAPSPQAIDPNGYLIFAITLGLTTDGSKGGYYGTNYVQFGRVTTTFTP